MEDDSFFCDQCGKEIMLCLECGRTGQGKCCDEDGTDLVSARTKAGAATGSASQRTDNLQNNTVIKSSDQETISGKSPLHSDLSAQQQNNQQSTSANQHSNGATSQPTSNSPVPRLMLVNTNLGLTLDISSGDILGRTTGPYASKLSGFPGISGKHLVFNYDMVDGWSFRDIGSSNGTKYHKTNKDWQNIAITNVNIPVPVENRSYILIANVEFVVQIENISNTGTQRL